MNDSGEELVVRDLEDDEDDEHRDSQPNAGPQEGLPVVARYPHGQHEEYEGKQREYPGQRVEQVDHGFDRPQLRCLEELDLAEVRRDGDLVQEPQPGVDELVFDASEELREVQYDGIALAGEDRVVLALDDVDHGRMGGAEGLFPHLEELVALQDLLGRGLGERLEPVGDGAPDE